MSLFKDLNFIIKLENIIYVRNTILFQKICIVIVLIFCKRFSKCWHTQKTFFICTTKMFFEIDQLPEEMQKHARTHVEYLQKPKEERDLIKAIVDSQE